jgi:phosphatidylglycerol:prolipoprotein diacylglycerol transferase
MPPTTTDFLGTTIHKFEIALGPLPITGFGIAMLMAFLIGQFVATSELTRRGQHDSAEAMGDIVVGAVVGGLLGAKIYYMILFHESFFSRGGFVFWGGLVGGITATAIVIRMKKLSFTRISDATSIGLAAAYAVGRSGCWAVGDDYGRPWNSALAVKFPDGAPPSTVGNMVSQFGVTGVQEHNVTDVMGVYPTQLFEVTMGLVMFAILWRMRDHKHAEGWLFGVYCVLAGVERFIVEFFRAKDDRFFAGFTIAQTIAIGFVALGVVWMQMRRTPRDGAPGIYTSA